MLMLVGTLTSNVSIEYSILGMVIRPFPDKSCANSLCGNHAHLCETVESAAVNHNLSG